MSVATSSWQCERCGAVWTDRPVGDCHQCDLRTTKIAPAAQPSTAAVKHCQNCRSDQHDAMGARVNGQRLRCTHCRKYVDGNRVYFGVVGPFCCVPCRDRWPVTKEGQS